jgi:hypothetical protein
MMFVSALLFLPAIFIPPVRCQKPLQPLSAKPAFALAPDDNGLVIAMMKKGLEDDIIVAKIKGSNWAFLLSDDAMLALRKQGVSARVIAVMIDHMVLTGASVFIDGEQIEVSTLSQSTTGGRLLNNLTGDLTPLRQNAFLDGAVASTSASPMPLIKITVPRGDSINNYILVQMKQKDDRREIEVNTGSGISNSRSGVETSAIRKTIVIPRGDNSFQLLPMKPLKHGAYLIYIIGSADQRKNIFARGYEFSVLD